MIQRVGAGPTTMFFLLNGRISPPICTGCGLPLGHPGDPDGRGALTGFVTCACRFRRRGDGRLDFS